MLAKTKALLARPLIALFALMVALGVEVAARRLRSVRPMRLVILRRWVVQNSV